MIDTRSFGGMQVSAIGMGAMTLTQTLDRDPEQGARAVRAALDCGVTLFDTADSYGPTSEMGVNEKALIAALRAATDSLEHLVIATKGGHTRGPNSTWWIDGSPRYLAHAARESLRRLGLLALPLYQHHRPDPRVPYEESMGALRQLVDDGIAIRVGISNVDRSQLQTAIDIIGDALVSVQNEYSPFVTSSESVLRMCEEHGIAFLAWGPFGGMRAAKGLGVAAPAFLRVADRHGVSPQQVALAWLLSLSPNMVPVPGASRPESVRDSVAGASLLLSSDDLLELTAAVAGGEPVGAGQ